MAQESIHSSAQRRARGKAVQEEPSRRKEPSPTSRKEPALKMKAGAWKPPIDLRDHLNKRAAAQTTQFDVSASHRSPHAEEDLRDTLRKKRAARQSGASKVARTTTVNEVDLNQIKEEMKRDILHQVIKEVCGKEGEGSRRTSCPFSDEIMAAPFPSDFKMPNIATYDGRGDPINHVDGFKTWMNFVGVSELARCRAFPLTLSGPAQAWHHRLEPRSITSFTQLASLFEKQFLGAKPLKKPSGHLMSVKQGENEPLDEYAKRFNDEAMQVEDYIDQAAV